MADPDDFELLQAWRDGVQRAGNELFTRHFSAVNRFFRSKVDGGVEDLVQATFLACAEARDNFRGTSSFRGYLFGIARHQLFGYYRRRRTDVDFETCSVIDLGGSPSQAVGGREEQQLLLQALRRLPLDHQIVIELYYWEELKGPELADVLGISAHTVRSRLSRARASLRESVERLASGQDVAESTLRNLEDWAAQLRQRLSPESTPQP
ncbi:MAG: sigma-70 family RNA polymerase sigma factor [Myxococcota bacterium]